MNYETGVRYAKALTNAKARSRAEQVPSVARTRRRRLVYVDSMPKLEALATLELPAISAAFFRFSNCNSLRLLIIKLSTVRLFSGNGPLAKCEVSSGTFQHKHQAGRFHVRD
jgi:hypothetical protein